MRIEGGALPRRVTSMPLPIETANLAPELRRHVHADFLANERAYLAMRAQLTRQHNGRWVAIHDGAVAAVADNLPSIVDAAAALPGHPFVACVGHEDAASFTVRRVEFAYDQTYQPVSMPHIELDFFNFAETRSESLAEVIPDTGGDMSLLPEDDCLRFDLFSGPYLYRRRARRGGGWHDDADRPCQSRNQRSPRAGIRSTGAARPRADSRPRRPQRAPRDLRRSGATSDL
jgi:hypothetical protein